MFGWTKRDSYNLESISISLERLVEREVIRKTEDGFLGRFLREPENKEIKVSEPNLEEAYDAEREQISQRTMNRITELARTDSVPFFFEDALGVEELDNQ